MVKAIVKSDRFTGVDGKVHKPGDVVEMNQHAFDTFSAFGVVDVAPDKPVKDSPAKNEVPKEKLVTNPAKPK